MKLSLLIVIIILGVTSAALGQKIPVPKRQGVNENCYYKAKYSAEKRLSFYPFSISDSIVLVSFRHHENNYPIHEDSVVVDSLIEIKQLNKHEIDQLTDILYNNFYIKPGNIGSLALCFDPRNAILFFKGGKLKESIIICFHCSRYKTSSKKYSLLGAECNQKLEKIRAFFIAKGISVGTDLSIDFYPGETFMSDFVAPPIEK